VEGFRSPSLSKFYQSAVTGANYFFLILPEEPLPHGRGSVTSLTAAYSKLDVASLGLVAGNVMLDTPGRFRYHQKVWRVKVFCSCATISAIGDPAGSRSRCFEGY
jgi:hypothetical protein